MDGATAIYLQLYGALLFAEYLLTHFTHLWGYTGAASLLLLRLHHGESVPFSINMLLGWVALSYMRTGPTYDGVCLIISDRFYEPLALAANVLLAAALVALKIPDSTYLNNKATYAYLFLLLIPQPASLFTCIPLYDELLTSLVATTTLVFRLTAFAALCNTREYRTAGVCLTLQIYLLAGYLVFLLAFYSRELAEFATAQYVQHEALVAAVARWRVKIAAVVWRDRREDDDS
jgi:hypothetical protein